MNNISKTFCFALAILTVVISSEALDAQSRKSRADDKGRKFTEIKKDLESFSKAAIKAETHEARLNSVLDLALLYFEIRTDVRYPMSDTLQGYGRRVNFRLNKVKKEIEKELARQDKKETKKPVEQIEEFDESLMVAAIGVSDQMMLMSFTHGGPHRVVDSVGGYFGGIVQADPTELIELIQNVVHPDSWETNGGVGAIGYWSQSMVLVVRATTQVHEDLERFLNMIKYAY